MESINYSIHNRDLIELELLGNVLEETKSCFPDISSIINCVLEWPKIYDADEILFNWRLQKGFLYKLFYMVSKENVDIWVVNDLSKGFETIFLDGQVWIADQFD